MTYPKRGAVWDANREIGDHGEETVGKAAPECQIMRNLVNCQEKILVGSGAEDVGDGPEFQGPEGSGAEIPGQEDLEGDNGGNDILCQWLRAAELGNLSGRKGEERKRIGSAL